MELKKGFDKTLKNISSESQDFLRLARSVWKLCWSPKQQPQLKEIFLLIFFPILLQKPIQNSCRRNLWYKPILVLSNTELKMLTKKPGDEMFRVLFKFPRLGWDERPAYFNRFSFVEALSCCFCLVLYIHAYSLICVSIKEFMIISVKIRKTKNEQ